MKDRITVVGNVAGSPEKRRTISGDTVVNFRLGCTQSHFDSRTGAWVDDETNWYSVSAYRTLAENALESIHQGERVIVTGTLRLRKWEAGEKKGTSADIDADALGHDLRWGRALYRKVQGAGDQRKPEADGPDAGTMNADEPAENPTPVDQWHTATIGEDDPVTVGA